jgi:hypothetical protein
VQAQVYEDSTNIKHLEVNNGIANRRLHQGGAKTPSGWYNSAETFWGYTGQHYLYVGRSFNWVSKRK